MKSCLVALALLVAACGPTAAPATPATPAPTAARVLVLVTDDGVALQGHDPVAYLTDGEPVLGSDEHTSRHGGAVYWFASAEHKATFDADPARYAPRYGGYCAYAASQNRLSPIEPDSWELLDGQLVLFTNPEFHRLFDEDAPGHKAKADGYWPGLVTRFGTPAATP